LQNDVKKISLTVDFFLRRIKRSAKKKTRWPLLGTHNVFTLFRGSHTRISSKEVSMPTAVKKPAAKKAAKPVANAKAAAKPAAKAKAKAKPATKAKAKAKAPAKKVAAKKK
jgi:hypothetical protein